ncbi:MAG: hypothetical protein JNM51_07300 [Bacteroidia bacterium]|nr:hypothetical protein [Bacteroidia bacterium]
MKTIKKAATRGTLLTILSLLTTSLAFSQEKSKFLNEKPEDLIVSGYIIGGVAIFGILIFVISKIVAKYSKEEDSGRRINRQIPHRHHHHRVVKKSS